jgi:hypothetical protein
VSKRKVAKESESFLGRAKSESPIRSKKHQYQEEFSQIPLFYIFFFNFFQNPLDKHGKIVYNTFILTLYQAKAQKRKEKENEKIFNTHPRTPHGVHHGSRLLGL